MALSLAITATTEEKLLTQTIEAMFGAQAGYVILKSIAADAEINGVDGVADGLVAFAENTETAETFAASIVANLGITVESTGSAAAVAEAVDFVAAQLNAAGEANWGSAVLAITILFAGLEDDATYGDAATAYNISVIESLNYSLDIANQAPYYGPADSGVFNLTTGLDSLMGTVGDDSFIARIVDNANTAQSADVIDGGEGNDTLTADIGNSQAFAITLETNSVENFVVRTQANADDTNQNNMPGSVQIDAQRMDGTNRYELNDGRADLIIEDVRIEDAQITKDITVAMVQTDPGDVDFGVYFDQHSLRKLGETTADDSLNLNLMSVKEFVDDINKPVANNPFNKVAFELINAETGITETVALELLGMDTVETYVDLLGAVNDAINVFLVGADAGHPLFNVTASITEDNFSVNSTFDGLVKLGDSITLTNSGVEEFSALSWTSAEKVQPPETEFFSSQTDGVQTTTGSLITSTIILDDVGRGSNGGDLVVGGLSTGDTSNSQGVEQFDIYVDRNSKLGTINSTNNTLREVYIVNEDNNADSDSTATGNLTVDGNNAGGNELPGDTAQDNAFGFSDVQVIDASAMVGEVHLTAELTNAVTAKYMDNVDVDGNQKVDNVANGDFNYTLGTADDSFALTMSSANLETAGTTTREDFDLQINGGAGNDVLLTDIDSKSGISDSTAWYSNSQLNANLNINGGAGNDMIHTSGAGDFNINAGSGDDTVYTDNSGNVNARPAVTEIQTITFGDAGDLATQTPVTVTLSNGNSYSTATTTVAGTTENSVVTFVGLTTGDVFTVDGLVFTATGAVTAAELTVAFNGGVITNGGFTGSLTSFTNTATAGVTSTYTSTTANAPVTNLVATFFDIETIATVTAVTANTPGVLAATAIATGDTAATVASLVAASITDANVTVTTNGADVILAYGANYAPAGSEDVASATVTGIATDSVATPVETTNGTDGTDAVAAITEVAVIQLATVNLATDTVSFANGDGAGGNVDVVFNDTDGNGTISLVEATDQLVAAASTLTGWTVTESNASLGLVAFTANTTGAMADLVVPGGEAMIASYTVAGNVVVEDAANPVITAAGTDATTFIAGAAEVQTITVNNGADQAGTVIMGIDTDSDGALENYTFNIAAGNESEVAAQLATQISALAGVSAAQGAGALSDEVIITWDIKAEATDNGLATQIAALSTYNDGAVKSASVAQPTQGLEATTAQAAAWVVNTNNTIITNLDSAGMGASALLFGAQLTVTYSGAATRGESGVTNGAAVANMNGFESTVTIGTESNVGNHTDINQAIKSAIIGDGSEGGLQGSGNVLEELLSVNDSPANTIAIHSLIDGEFAESDLAITVVAGVFSDMTSAQQSSLRSTWADINNDSGAVYSDAQMQAALDAAVTTYATGGALNNLQMATTDGTTLIAGSASMNVSDNMITLGLGDDVVVLGTDDQSNDTLVYTGTGNGYDTVVNFTETGTAADMIDFSAYLTAQTSTTGSAASAVDTAITLNGNAEAGANQVTIRNDFSNSPESTSLAAITAGFTVEDVANPFGGSTYNTIFMLENSSNDGEYAIYNVTAEEGDDFTSVELIGQVDFGNSLTAVTSATFSDGFSA